MRKWILLVLASAAIAASAQQNPTVASILVRGNQNISVEAILASMRVKKGEPLSLSQLQADEQAIRDLGYFRDVKVLNRAVSDTESEVIVEVSEYPVVREVRVVGNTVVSTEDATAAVIAIQPIGNVWNNRNARPIRDALAKIYEDKGYFVDFEQIGPDAVSVGTLTIAVLEPRVGEIKLIGLSRTKPSVVERIMKTRPGDVFSPRLWRRDIEELYYTYWFDKLEPAQPQIGDTPGEYDLAIEFSEARTGQLNAGVALDPQSRLVGTGSYSESNFLGLGKSIGVQLAQATVGGGPSVELAYGDRFYDRKDTSLNAQVFSKVVYNFTGSGFDTIGGGNNDRQFDERRTGFNLTATRPVRNVRYTLGLRGSNTKTLNVSSDPNVEFVRQDGDVLGLVLGASYDVRVPTAEPHSGELLSLTFEPGYSRVTRLGGVLAGETRTLGTKFFSKTSVEFRKYWSPRVADDAPLDKARPVLATRVRYSIVSGTAPFYEQVFMGGADSLRGYENQRFWGSQGVLASVEYRYPVQKSFTLIGFADYGGAWGGYGQLKDFPQSQTPRLRLGYGLGVGFRTPIGAIRIDFAFNQEGRNLTHFSLGTSF
ncbi:MAG: BamA/TamA family outer membrane protein [Fimbriimonadaceae bacterium]|nr:BamA/TamA family outer membrane protein [Fimbriimonadaceae bacterium]